jgi:hypothetical protein
MNGSKNGIAGSIKISTKILEPKLERFFHFKKKKN